MIPYQLDRIEIATILSLLTNQVHERRTLEYKQALPGNSDDDKKEFLADVSSFANAAGGDLLFGVVPKKDEKGDCTGEPDSIPGLAGISTDQTILRLESIIRDGIQPRIPGIHTRYVDGFSEGPVIIMRVPKSYAAPHMVTFKNWTKFFSRTSNGKYQLDVTEIRSAFALSESLPDRIRRFRDERLARIVAGETPVPLHSHAKLVLHLLPISALDSTNQISPHSVSENRTHLHPMGASGWDTRYNFDGYLSYAPDGTTKRYMCHSYAQFFRSGAIEGVDSRALRAFGNDMVVDASQLERRLLTALRAYFGLYRALNIDPPVVVMIGLLGVNGRYILAGDFSDFEAAFDRDTLLLPDRLAEDLSVDPDELLRPAFDAMWQASGWMRCFSYDENGKRVR